MINIALSSFLISIPEIYLISMVFLFIIIILLQDKLNNSQQIFFTNKFFYVTILIMLLCMFLVYGVGNSYVETFSSLFIISPIIYIFKLILILIFIIYLLLAKNTLIDHNIANKLEYLIILILLLTSNMLLFSSNDFLSLYVTLETATLCTYVIIFMNKTNSNLQSGLKYFLLSAVGTAFLLMGISYIYGFTGSTNFLIVKDYLSTNNNNWLVILSLVTIIIGFSFKLSLVPFHMWTADIYEGVDWSTTLLLATIAKISALFVLIKVLWGPFLPIYEFWSPIVQLLIIVTAIVGYLIMLSQINLKRFIAYSSIANMSYVLLGILFVNSQSIQHIIIYLVSYFLALFGFVGILLTLKHNLEPIEKISDLAGLSKKYPYLSFAIAVFTFSMAGLPITSGFFGKLLILLTAFNSNMYVLPSVIILITLVSLYFYFKIISTLYLHQPTGTLVYLTKQNKVSAVIISLLLIFTLLFAFFLNSIIDILQNIIVVI